MECNPIPKDPASELLSGEDFSRLNETAPRLLRALAERAGTSVASLRKMANEGRLTSDALLHGASTEQHRNAAVANAYAAAESARQAAASARLAEIDAKYARSGDLAGFLREVGEAGLTLADLADWLTAAGAAGIPKFAVGDMFRQVHPGEAIVPKTCTLRIGGAAGGGGGICGGGQPPAFNPWPEMLAASREIVRLNTQIAQLLGRWDSEGLPRRRDEV